MIKKLISIILTILIFSLVGLTVFLNYRQQFSIDRSKLPAKVESSEGFQKWITNLRNKGIKIEADEFKLHEENEIYNTRWLKIYSIDAPGIKDTFEKTLKDQQGIKQTAFSPSEREFIDYRHEQRGDFLPNEIRYYGRIDDNVLDARLLNCDISANCYFDRAYFLSNELFIVSEFVLNNSSDKEKIVCDITQNCVYVVKVHVVDLINNSRLVYIAKPFNLILSEAIPNF